MATPSHLVDVFLYFLELSFHSLLHARGVYPASFFEPRSAYGALSAPLLRHPELCDGIGALLSSLRPLLLRNVVERVLLVLLDPSGAALEQSAIAVATCARCEGGSPATQAEAERQLGAALLLLQQRARARAALPPDCTFTVQLRTHGPLDGAAVGLPLWASVRPGDAGALGGGGEGSGVGGGGGAGEGVPAATRRRPIKGVLLGQLAVDVFVEEEVL